VDQDAVKSPGGLAVIRVGKHLQDVVMGLFWEDKLAAGNQSMHVLVNPYWRQARRIIGTKAAS